MIAIAVTALWVAVVITQVVAELTVLTIAAVIVVAAVELMVVVTENNFTNKIIDTKVVYTWQITNLGSDWCLK